MRGMTAIVSVAVLFGFTGTAMAQQAVNDPSAGGQLNQCWGQVASQTAKLPTPEGTSGGGMGQHSRATKAADKNGGFANSDNAFGITFNTDGGRQGVGNVSKGAPHNAHPGDGGNGQHAINNSTMAEGLGFANLLNPVTGQPKGPEDDYTLACDLP